MCLRCNYVVDSFPDINIIWLVFMHNFLRYFMRSCLLTLVILKGLRFYQFKMSYLRIIQPFALQESSFILNFARTELQKFNGRVDVSLHCVLIVDDIFKSKLWSKRYILLNVFTQRACAHALNLDRMTQESFLKMTPKDMNNNTPPCSG